MFMAERTMVNFTTITAHYSRVLEYECYEGQWILTPDNYHVGGVIEVGGIPGTNASGGVDVDSDRVWASGDALRLNQPAPYTNIYGFTGIPIGGGTVADSLIIDYQDNLTDQDKTMLGDLVVTPQEETCTGDLSGDFNVNVDDLLVLLGDWGDCKTCDADLDNNGEVNIDDLLQLIGAWGACQ